MKTIIKGIKCREMVITPNCRKVNGFIGALGIAFKHIEKDYNETLSYPANKKATIRIVMTVDREIELNK